MTVRQLLTVAALAATCVVSLPATAHADDKTVIYEIVSDTVTKANVQYFDGTELQPGEGITLPWKVEAKVGDMSRGAKTANHAEIEADWTSSDDPTGAVTVRIYFQDKVVCQNTTATGTARCDYATFATYKDMAPPPAS